jgi:hypothetical protein
MVLPRTEDSPASALGHMSLAIADHLRLVRVVAGALPLPVRAIARPRKVHDCDACGTRQSGTCSIGFGSLTEASTVIEAGGNK